MKRALFAALAALAASAPLAPAAAQADILLQLRSGNPQGDRVRIDSAGGLVLKGELGIGIIPESGNVGSNPVRLMWHPYRGAFRAGTPGPSGSTNWNDANIGFYSWSGGVGSYASQFAGFAFGSDVVVTGSYGAGFGNQNTVSGNGGFAAGGNNRCADAYCVALGFTANADGQGAIAMGYRATADADRSVAIGSGASTNGRTGAFVLTDYSTTDSLEASANNQFNARFAGGYRLYSNATTTAGVVLNSGAGSWNSASDRNRKEHFLGVDGEDVLVRLRSVPVSSWRYISEEDRSVRHVGPMAQDWHRAFGLSADSLTINQGDFDGINLVAIQALEARTTAQAGEIASLRAENAELRARLERLEALLAAPPAGSRP